MEVIERSPFVAIVFTFILGLAIVGCVILWPIRIRELGSFFMIAGLVYMAWYAARFWTGHRKKLVVGPAGVMLITDRRVTHKYGWDEIDRVDLTKMSLDNHKRADGTVHSITEMDLGSTKRVKMAYEAVMSMRHSE